ncbi:uncharacterized protein LOC118432952 [Folsomia candida]|uniref:DUF4806 domain-containing protein n=1 Tax=Folsomia candida TaxID=158441 RepID=A0A226DG30_FOLCA|nr:uncharacterized protein LOC118432952 [Folsomia candida]OXA44090.1 hypothetical protein Fcan01_21173 [Folsomia candida]
MEFAVVEFMVTKEVATVPLTWISENEEETWWPPYKTNDRILKAVKIKEGVNPMSWAKHIIRVIKLYRTFATAVENEKKAVYTSNLESEAESSEKKKGNRPRRKTTKYNRDSDTSEENHRPVTSRKIIPCPPQPNLSPVSSSEPSPPPRTSTPTQYFSLAQGSGTLAAQRQESNLSKKQFVEGSSSSEDEGSLSALQNKLDAIGSNFKDGTQDKEQEGSSPIKFEDYVVHSLERLHQKIDLQGSVLVKLCNFVMAQNSKNPIISKSPRPEFKFPVENFEELAELEKKLMTSKLFYNQLVGFLAIIGGKDYKETIAGILPYLFTNELAEKIAWDGIRKKNPKKAFKTLRIKQVLFDAVRQNPLVNRSVTDKEMKAKGASWFQHATDRIKAAALKRNKGLEEEAEEI